MLSKKEPKSKIQTIVFQIVQKKTGRRIRSHAMAVLPQTFSLVESSRDTLQHTMGDIFEDRWGEAAVRFSITGVAPEHPTSVGGKVIDGAARFKDLRDLLRDYAGGRVSNASEQIKIRTDAGVIQSYSRSDVELQVFILADTLAPDSAEDPAREWYRAHLPASYFTFTKNVSGRHTNFPYSLNLVLIKRIDEADVFIPDVSSEALWKQRIATKTGRIAKWAKTLNALAAKAEKVLSAADVRIRRAFATAGRLQDSLERFIALYSEFGDALDRYQKSVDSFLNFPFRSVRELASITDRIYQTLSLVVDEPTSLQNDVKATLNYLEFVLSGRRFFFKPLGDSTGRRFGSSLRVEVTAGTTLESIAQRYDVLVEELISLNRLQYPFIVDFDTPTGAEQFGKRVLKQGDTLLVPQVGSPTDSATPAFPEDLTGRETGGEDEFYGTAWALDSDGLMHGNSAQTGFLRVVGIESVRQALRVRMMTERGAFPIHPEYGIERFLGKRATHTALAIMQADFHGQIAADPRVEGVDKVRLEQENGVMSAEITVSLKNAKEGTTVRLNSLENLT